METAGSTLAHRGVRFGTEGLADLVERLLDTHDEVLGPVERDGVIRLGPVRSADDFPTGRRDVAVPGGYRLVDRDDRARFGHAVGPDSARSSLHPARAPVWTAVRVRPAGGDGREEPAERIEVRRAAGDTTARALIVRPCDAAAVDVLGDVVVRGPHVDPIDAPRFAGATVVVVECGAPASTCLCASTGTGPAIGATPHDVVLTEVLGDDGDPWYLARAGSARGAELLGGVAGSPADDADVAAARAVTDAAAREQVRVMPADARRRVVDQPDHPRWDDVASRCLACTNCTLVCPTCFCVDVLDRTELDGSATRERVWDSCFSTAYATLGGRSIRPDTRGKYRHWLTHKVGTWHDHFGRSGCVGCGRCITWCPVGIDLTAELDALATEAT